MDLGIKKVDSVSFRVKDLERAAKWYTETLGLPEIYRMDERHMRGYGIGDNSATLNVQQGPGGAQLVVQVDRVDKARTALEAKGVKFTGETVTIPGIGKGATLKDPDGNEIFLLDYTIEHGEA